MSHVSTIIESVNSILWERRERGGNRGNERETRKKMNGLEVLSPSSMKRENIPFSCARLLSLEAIASTVFVEEEHF
jgi:hypothetical protein